MENFDNNFKNWFTLCKKVYTDYMALSFPNLDAEEFTYKINRRYIKITRGTSVWAFVDKTNGDVLKAASWRAPARHARGNVNDENGGMGSITPYGPRGLR